MAIALLFHTIVFKRYFGGEEIELTVNLPICPNFLGVFLTIWVGAVILLVSLSFLAVRYKISGIRPSLRGRKDWHGGRS